MASLPFILFSRRPLPFERLDNFSSKTSETRHLNSSADLEWIPRSREYTSNIITRRNLTRQARRKASPTARRRRSAPMVEARLFGPALFESSKLRVLLLAKEEDDNSKQQAQEQPRIYTLTHSDVTAQITLTVAREINNSQLGGWYKRLQRDEVLAEWRETKGVMALHVHCHISGGGNWLHTLVAKLRFHIFQKELPIVLQAFMVGDRELFRNHPELNFAPVWVYFHSSLVDYNGVECWGPFAEAIRRQPMNEKRYQELPSAACVVPCHCCSRHSNVVPVPDSLRRLLLSGRQNESSP